MKNFTPKRNEFYFFQMNDKQSIRHNKISDIFGEEQEIYYLGDKKEKVDELYLARFWKDKKSAMGSIKKDDPLILKSIDRETFIKSIPDHCEKNSYSYLRNLKIKEEEIFYKTRESKVLSKYKVKPPYTFPENWFSYLPCKNCGLRPLVWERNNQISTGCGCGELYNHFSIKVDSNHNNELRDSWNLWVTNMR